MSHLTVELIMRQALLVPLILLAPAVLAQDRPTPRALKDFDAYVAKGVKEWEVPGLAIALVQGDSTIFARGYGVRTLGGTEAVDAHTLFANASTTKAFTSMVAAMMVDEGRMRWDDAVTLRLPGFALGDAFAARDLTVRDLLTHRVGFPDPDYLWSGNSLDFDHILARLRFVRPVSGWRARFAYNNVTYAAAGEIAGRLAGGSWDDLVRRRILVPLGMNETVTRMSEAESRGNVASAHARVDDTIRVIARYDADNIRPAGSMYSSVTDMGRWLRFLLDSARVGGTRLVSDTSFAQLFHPQQLVSADEFYPTAELTHPHFTAYGMGWFLEDYRGAFVAFHTGSIDGMCAIVGLLPERKAGVVVFANLDHAELRHALMYRAFDLFLGGVGRDWSSEMRALYRARAERARAARRQVEETRVVGTSPSLALDKYAGTYSDSLYGSITVSLSQGTLLATISPYLTADLEHWHYDTFRAVWRNRWLGKNLLTFRLGTDGQVAQIDLGGGQVYTRAGIASE